MPRRALSPRTPRKSWKCPLEDLAGIEAFFASEENAKALENRISVSRRIHPKSEVALNHYFLEIFHALTCGKIALNVAFTLFETLIGAFAFLSRKVRDRRVAILTSDGTAPGDPETLAKIVAKTPTDALEFPEETLADIAEEGAEAKNRVFIDPGKVSVAILACANNSSSDIAGVSFELIKSLLGRAHSGGKNNFLSFFSFLIEEVARDPDGKCFSALSAAKYIAIAKPKSSIPGDIRPIGITSVFRRIFGKYVMIESGKLVGGVLSSSTLEKPPVRYILQASYLGF